jgi:hypothetical protein
MDVILLLLYLFVFTWLVTKTPFFLRSGLSPKFLAGYFLVSTGVSIGHLWFAYHNFPGHGDMWTFFSEGVKLKNYLLRDFSLFLKEMRVDVYEQGAFTSGSFLVRIQYQFLSFIYMLFNFLSFSNNYINLILFGYLLLFGKIGLYRTAKKIFPENETGNLGFLLLPGILFWTGPIHKEGIIYVCLGLIVYGLAGFNARKILLLILAVLLIIITRNYVLILIVLAAILSLIFFVKNYRFKAVLEVGAIITGLSLLIFPQLLLPVLEQVINRKQEFDSLGGNTRLPIISLEPTFRSFAAQFPTAFLNAFLLPYPGQFNPLYSLFSFEIYGILALLIYGLIKSKSNPINGSSSSGYLGSFLIFGILGILICGYIIPFAGALVRYRSIYLPFLWTSAFFLISNNKLVHKLNSTMRLFTN